MSAWNRAGFAALLVTMVASGFFVSSYLKGQASGAATNRGTQQRPEFTLNDLQNKPRRVGEWNGKVLVVNFWATWCPPCRKEIPQFIALQQEFEERGLQFLGIAIDDREAVREFAQSLRFNYPILVGEQDAVDVAIAYGNVIGALPYTVVVDRKGTIVLTHQGELSGHRLEQVIVRLI
ncbi:MAG: TlpA family protein disulfide reductase [Gammaproteobacteria bacterium]